MKIVHVVPGSGGTFYCQNCMRDLALVRTLRAAGHDVVMVPLYLPLAMEEGTKTANAPVFYGAINVYLKQVVPFLRRAPRWLERLFDAPKLLDWAATKAGSTRATGLGDMTISMLRGEDGNQAQELDRLVQWLEAEGAPDVVHFSNALLLGLARRIKQQLRVPLACTLQDEDVWLDALDEPQRQTAWDTLAERAADIDAFVAVSRYYAELMQDRARIPADRMHVVHVGIELEGYEPAALTLDPPVIGFLSRMAESLGLETVVDAFIDLRRQERFATLELRATGGKTGDDEVFLRGLERRLAAHGLRDAVRFLPDFDRAGRLEFLRSLSVMTVPVPKGEAFGTFQIEAMAAGVPVAQPRVGAFPEIVEATGGGVLYEPNDAATLAATIADLLDHPDTLRELGRRGRESVLARFGIEHMAERILALYGNLKAT